MSDPAPKHGATYQDVVDAPEHKVAELIDGELHLSPRPGGLSTVAASVLGSELVPPFHRGRGGPGGWIILDEPEVHFGEDVIIPDLAGWRRDRLPVIPDTAFFTVPPDWVCEVLSPSTERIDRVQKLPLYASWGIGHAWLVHPRRRWLEAYRLHEGKWLSIGIYKDDDKVRIEPFEALELDLAALWADAALPTRASEEAAEYGYL